MGESGKTILRIISGTQNMLIKNLNFVRKNKNLIFLLGAYGQENIGDETILKIFLKFFSDRVVFVTSSKPEKTQQMFNVHAVHSYGGYSEKLRVLLNSDLIIFGGGSLLKELPFRSGRWRYSVLVNIFIGVLFAKLLRKKVIFSAIGVGPLKNISSKFLTKIIIKLGDLVTVRDSNSKKLLKNIGINQKIIVVADPAFLVDQRKQGICSKDQDHMNLIVGICPLYNLRDDASYENMVKVISKFCDWLIEKHNAEIFFIPFQFGYNPYNDIKVNEDIIKFIQNKSNINNILEQINTTEKMLNLISNIDIIIGFRLHSLIFAILKNKPFLAISYDDKVENLLRDINWKYYIHDNKLNFNELILKFEKLMKYKIETLYELENIKINMTNKAKLNFHLMQKYLKENEI